MAQLNSTDIFGRLLVSRNIITKGNIGVGTVNPKSDLHIVCGANSLDNNNISEGIALGSSKNGDKKYYNIQITSPDGQSYIDLSRNANKDFDVRLMTKRDNALDITASAGVGINKENGIGSLHIGNLIGKETLIVERTAGRASIKGGSSGDNNFIIDSTTTGTMYLQHYVGGNLVLVNGGGNVLIGNGIEATERLNVNGSILLNNTLKFSNGSYIENNTNGYFDIVGDGNLRIYPNGKSDDYLGFNSHYFWITTAGNSISTWGVLNSSGRLSWGDGTNQHDTNLYRVSANHLKTDDTMTVGSSFNVGSNALIGGTLGVTGITTLNSTSIRGTLGVVGATTFSSHVEIEGALGLESTLNVTGVTTLSSTLNVTGITTLGSNTSIDGTLSVTNSATLSNTLSVGSTLNVAGITTLMGNLNVNGDVFIDNNLDIFKALSVGSSLDVGGTTTLSDLDVGGSLTLTGIATLVSDLSVKGDTSLTGTLTVGGVTTFKDEIDIHDNLFVAGTLVVTGGTTVNNTLSVGSSLDVGGSFALTGIATLNNNTSIGGTLDVTGATTLSSTLGVLGDTDLEGGLDVEGVMVVVGATTLSSTLSVLGATTLSSTLSVSGITTLSSNLDVGGTLSVTGASTLDNVLVKGTLNVIEGATLSSSLSVGATLDVTGITTLDSDTSIGGTLDVEGATILSSTLGVTSNTSIGGTLSVSGISTLRGNTSITGTLGATGATTLENTLSVGSTLSVTGATTLSSTLGVTGVVTLGNALNVTGATTLSSTLDVGDDTTVDGTFLATGATTLESTLNVTGATILSSTLNVGNNLGVGGTLNVTGITTLSSNTSISGTLGVTGVVTLSTNTSVGGTFRATGATTLSSTLSVGTNATIGGTLGVTGVATFSNTATFNKNISVIEGVHVGGGLSVEGTLEVDSNLIVGNGILVKSRGTTIGSSSTTFNNGWLRIGELANGIAMDDNEILKFGGAFYFGTNTAHNIIFRVGGSDRFTMTTDGRLGIGTTSPSYGLHVRNNNTIMGLQTSTTYALTDTDGYAGISLTKGRVSNSSVGYIRLDNLDTTGTSASRMRFIVDNSTNSGRGVLTVVGNDRVGINQINPSSALDVVGAIKASSGYYVGSVQVINSSGNITSSDRLPIVNVDKGGTGLSSIASGRILFGGSSATLGNSANFSWNNTTNSLSVIGKGEFTDVLTLKGQGTSASVIDEINDTALMIEHSSRGSSSIQFKSAVNTNSDSGYIRYKDCIVGTTEYCQLIIGVEDNSTDSIMLKGHTIINNQSTSSQNANIVLFQHAGVTKATLSSAGRLDLSHGLNVNESINIASGSGKGINFWDSYSYSIYMSTVSDSSHGGRVIGETTSDYNMYFKMQGGGTNRGFVFKSNNGNVAQIDGGGNLYLTGYKLTMGNGDAIISFNDSNNTSREGYYTGKDSIQFGSDGTTTNMVIKAHHVDVGENIYVEKKIGVKKYSFEYNELDDSFDLMYNN